MDRLPGLRGGELNRFFGSAAPNFPSALGPWCVSDKIPPLVLFKEIAVLPLLSSCFIIFGEHEEHPVNCNKIFFELVF